MREETETPPAQAFIPTSGHRHPRNLAGGHPGGIRLADGTIASVCNVRDPVGAAIIASRAFPVQTEKHWRKLQWTEVREVLRAGFTEWQTLPDGVVTDNELSLGAAPPIPSPAC